MRYNNVNITNYFNYLNGKWYKIDTNTRKQKKSSYYEKWNQEDHITVLGKRLNYDQANLADFNVIITEEDKLQLYIEKMHDIATLEKEYIINWENSMESDRTWANSTKYFEDLIVDIKMYHSNIRGTFNQARYESAANVREG